MEPAQGTATRAATVDIFSSAEYLYHRSAGLCHPAGVDDTAAGTAADEEEWDSPPSISVALDFLATLGDTEAIAQQPAYDNPETFPEVMEYLRTVEGGKQTGDQQPRGAAAAVAAEPGPAAAAAAAAAENPNANITPRRAREFAPRGVAGQEAGTQVKTPCAAAAAGPATSQAPPAVNSSSNSASALREGNLTAPGAAEPRDVAEVQAVAGEARAEVQAGEADGMRTSPGEAVLLERAGGGDGSRSGCAEGAPDSVEQAVTTTAPIRGPAVGKEETGRARIGGEVAGTVHQPLNFVNGGCTLVLLDVETTGLKPEKNDRVIELAAKVLGSEDPKHVFHAHVDPEGTCIPQEIQVITGITPHLLAKKGARPFREVLPRFLSWLTGVASEGGGGGGVVLAAHNAHFDRRFLAHEVDRAGLDSSVLCKAGVTAILDTIMLMRTHSVWRKPNEPYRVPSLPTRFSLSELFKHLFGRPMENAHSALGDVEGLERVLSSPCISERWRRAASADEAFFLSRSAVLPPVKKLRVSAETAHAPRAPSKQPEERSRGV